MTEITTEDLKKLSKEEYDELRLKVKDAISVVLAETEKRIHKAIAEDDKEYLTRFFFKSEDKKKFDKLLKNPHFNEKEREYLKNHLKEMGKL